MKNKILLFFGSFDPFHNGHYEMLKKASKLYEFQKIIIIPSNKKFALKKEFKSTFFRHQYNLTSFYDRKKMIELAVSKHFNNVIISDYEILENMDSYTYRSLEFFRSQYFDSEFFILMGSDNLVDFINWKNYQKIINNAFLISCNRSDFNEIPKKLISYQSKIILINDFKFDFSSTIFKNTHDKQYVDRDVFLYINQNGLYGSYLLEKHIINSSYSDYDKRLKRAEHSLRVASLTYLLMLKYDSKNANMGYCAGIYHDILKMISEEESINYLEQNNDVINIYHYDSWKLLHPYIGAHLLKYKYEINDDLILNAIKRHTKPYDYHNDELSVLDICLYCADKLESHRIDEKDLINIDYYRKKIFKSLNDLIVSFKEIYEFNQKLNGE